MLLLLLLADLIIHRLLHDLAEIQTSLCLSWFDWVGVFQELVVSFGFGVFIGVIGRSSGLAFHANMMTMEVVNRRRPLLDVACDDLFLLLLLLLHYCPCCFLLLLLEVTAVVVFLSSRSNRCW